MSTATASDAGSAAARRPGEPALPEAVMHAVLPTAPVTGKVDQSRLCTKGKSAS